MDGPHDLGGKDGFGPIDVTAPPFREDWEARQWALSKNVPIPGATIDWWRHGIENMDPATYMSVPYFVKWNLNEIAHRVDQGMFTLEEAVSGRAAQSAPPANPASMDMLLERLRTNNTCFARPLETPPSFAIGDMVVTQTVAVPGHTRLPAYARGAVGRIAAGHGGHLFADAGAEGRHVVEHLYTVEFAARVLWGAEADAQDTVCLDLWEPYLAPA
ncbi:MAG: nitrile hydratase subunit beta [Pseudomonadota bacterium]